MAYDPTRDPFRIQQYQEQAQARREPPPKTVGSARIVEGVLRLNFTDDTRIDIPMAVVSEIVAVVLAGRLAMGLSEATSPADPR